MAIIAFTGNTTNTTYSSVGYVDQIEWLKELDIIALDTETNVVDSILARVLKVISIADEDGENIWVIQWEYLSTTQQKELLHIISTKTCIIQNVSFDYTVFKKYGVTLEKVYDTMLAEQVPTTGLASESGFHGLQAIYERRFDLDISKSEQLTFGDTDEYSDNQIEYAAIDVLKLGILRRLQLAEMFHQDKRVAQKGNKGLRKTLWWENEFVKAVGDMELTGIRLDKDKWYAIEDSVKPIFDKELEVINEIAKRDFYDVLVDNNWISDKDEFTVPIWSSSAKKKLILEEVYDFDIEKTAKTELKKYLQEHDPDFPEGLKLSGKAWSSSEYPTTLNSNFAIIKLLVLATKDNKDYINKSLDGFLITNMKQFCIDNGWLRPANTLTLNWASPAQRLKVFQAINPSIESTGKDIIQEYIDLHELVPHYLIWTDIAYKLKSFGKPFYDKHVELDGKHRTRFNQILATGRLSSVSPNFLNVPNDPIYRDCIIPDEGFELVGADYSAEELVITATLAQEPAWMEAFKHLYDVHSINAELMYGDKWKNATEEDCIYEKEKKQCNCDGHMKMRKSGKTVSFGSLYGMSYFSLSAQLRIPQEEAKQLLESFFDNLPNIKAMMTRVQDFAIDNGYIIEPVFGRIRYFEKWKIANPEHHGGIRRASGNYIIQASASAVLKIAIILLRRWINHNNHQDSIQLILPVHDELLLQTKPAFTTLAKEKVEYYMELAGKLAGFKLTAEAKSGMTWKNCH